MDISQGNVLTSEMLAKLKPGMTPGQVKYLLGTPLLVDPFHAHRWDYVYRYSKAGKLVESRRVTVVFENDKLKGIEGDIVPTPVEAAKPEPAKADAPVQPVSAEAEKK